MLCHKLLQTCILHVQMNAFTSVYNNIQQHPSSRLASPERMHEDAAAVAFQSLNFDL